MAQSSTAAPAGLLGVLHAEGAFAGLSWADAKQLAAPVSFYMCIRDDAGRSSATAPAMCLEGFDEGALIHSEPAGRT